MRNKTNNYGSNNSKKNVAYGSCYSYYGGVFSGVLEVIGIKGCGLAPAIRKSSTSKQGEGQWENDCADGIDVREGV